MLRAAFGGYLFVRVRGVRGLWDEVLRTSDVHGAVRHGGGYAELDDAVIESLEARARPGDQPMSYILPAPSRVSDFRFGDRVQVLGNSHASGRVGIFQSA